MINTTPLVSIIMAAKDTAIYLEDCLDSIIAQTYPNWELIAINDHSSDETPEILESYASKDERIRVFHSDRPKLIPTLKYGYQFAKGDLINRMDSDDKMPIDKLECLVSAWQAHGKGNIIAGGTKHFVDDGEVGGGFLRYEEWLNEVARNSTHYQEIYQECVIPSHCWIIHKDDFDLVDGFNPEVYPEDYDLCFRFYKHKLRVIGIDKVLHHWRDRSNRISRTWDEYKDNRYFSMKLKYFYALDRDKSRPLVLWGTGRNGKDMAKLLKQRGDTFHWVSDNARKVGINIYDIQTEHFEVIQKLVNPQIMVVVASPDGKIEIRNQLDQWNKEPVRDYWFFT
ncbi:glycosyltransferase [Roseivirga sp. E12]|uniref:glycosyltransferase family 2 protein n=1 Tax=Roseivirga sp. E12 TaxID=2819237 RepID=UPI001ABC4A3D|nr:glycosyltransferase [Roseivirga sp. E12]MBO3697814.1 glycosyltransferase [Roseivirga sp. E12]